MSTNFLSGTIRFIEKVGHLSFLFYNFLLEQILKVVLIRLTWLFHLSLTFCTREMTVDFSQNLNDKIYTLAAKIPSSALQKSRCNIIVYHYILQNVYVLSLLKENEKLLFKITEKRQSKPTFSAGGGG